MQNVFTVTSQLMRRILCGHYKGRQMSRVIVEAEGYKVLASLPGWNGQQVFLCAKAKGRTPFRIVVVKDDAVAGAFPDRKSCELEVYNRERLHRGKYILFDDLKSAASKCHLSALNLETLAIEPKYFTPEMNEMAMFIGVDVDPTGRYTLIASCWDDFPDIVIHDAESDEFIKIDCEELIDAPIRGLHWKQAPNRIIATHEYNDEEFEFPLDFEKRKAIWQCNLDFG